MESTKITYDLIIRFSQRPKEFLEWTRNYFVEFTNQNINIINLRPYFIASQIQRDFYYKNDSLGIFGCFYHEDTFQIILNSINKKSFDPNYMTNLVNQYRKDRSKLSSHDILTLLLEGGYSTQKTNPEIILNQKVNMFPKSTLLYGLMELILTIEKFQTSKAFCFIYGMLYYFIYTARTIDQIYFGPAEVAKQGLSFLRLDGIENTKPKLYYPNTFSEFILMFMRYYKYIEANNIQFGYDKQFMIYFYEHIADTGRLDGYLIASESGHQLYEILMTDIFQLFVEKHQERFSELYDQMKADIGVGGVYNKRQMNEHTTLSNKKKVEVEVIYLDDMNAWLHANKFQTRRSELEFEFDILLNSYRNKTVEYEFIKLCIVMSNLCGWHTLVIKNDHVELSPSSPNQEIPIVNGDFGSSQEIYVDVVKNGIFPQLDIDEFIKLCITDKKYQQLCKQDDFKKTYEQEHFTITYDLMIKLSQQPKEFLRWVRNYFKWYAFTNEISMNACFILPFYQNKCFINTNGDGIIGCFLNDDIYNSLEDAAIAVVSAINKYYTLEYHIKRYFKSEKDIKFKDNTKLPDIYDILTILLEDGNTLSKDNRTKNSLQLLLNETIMMYPHSTITYGLLDFIIYHGLNDSPQFCFILGMMYYLIGEKAINKIYFGDIKVLSYGFEQDDNMLLLYDDESPTLEFPDTFDEFRQMFMRYYSYIQNNNIRLSPNRNFIAYIYDIFEDQLGLDGYFITSDNDGNQLHEIFGTVLLNSYIDNHKDRIDYIYTMMLEDIGDRIYSTQSGRGFYDKDVDVSYLQRALRWLLRLNNNTTYEGYRNIMLELTGQPLYRLRFNKVGYEIDQKMMVEDPYYYSDGEDTLDEDKPIASWKNETFYTTEFKRLLKGRAVKSVEYQFIEMCMVMLNLCGYNVLMYLDLQ